MKEKMKEKIGVACYIPTDDFIHIREVGQRITICKRTSILRRDPPCQIKNATCPECRKEVFGK